MSRMFCRPLYFFVCLFLIEVFELSCTPREEAVSVWVCTGTSAASVARLSQKGGRERGRSRVRNYQLITDDLHLKELSRERSCICIDLFALTCTSAHVQSTAAGGS